MSVSPPRVSPEAAKAEGKKAFHNGVGLLDNPYGGFKEHRKAAQAWMHGWIEEQMLHVVIEI